MPVAYLDLPTGLAADTKKKLVKEVADSNPCVVGRGKLFFREGEKTNLKLMGQKTLVTGVVVFTYQPVGSRIRNQAH